MRETIQLSQQSLSLEAQGSRQISHTDESKTKNNNVQNHNKNKTSPKKNTAQTDPSWIKVWVGAGPEKALENEAKLLKYSRANMELIDLKIGDGPQDYIHGVVGGPKDGEPLVLLPGYGSGCAFYYRILEFLCQKFRTYSIDLIGTGLSGRPSFPCKDREQSEHFFTDSLRKWQESEGLEQINLMGHSLGGYLAAKYALTYQDKVKSLHLICPAGVSTRMDLVSNLQKRNKSILSQYLISLGKMGYDMGVTPQAIIRTLGPFGVGLIHGYVTNRLQTLPYREACVMEQYLYQIFALRGSGEYALRYIIGSDAQGFDPLEKKLHQLDIPVMFIYGEFDWTDPKCADRVIQKMKKNQCFKFEVKGAGHQTYVDNPADFCKKFYEGYRRSMSYIKQLQNCSQDVELEGDKEQQKQQAQMQPQAFIQQDCKPQNNVLQEKYINQQEAMG